MISILHSSNSTTDADSKDNRDKKRCFLIRYDLHTDVLLKKHVRVDRFVANSL